MRVSDLATGEKNQLMASLTTPALHRRRHRPSCLQPLASRRPLAVLTLPAPERLRPPPAVGHARATNPYTHEEGRSRRTTQARRREGGVT
jgi:hypothetical protein